MLFELIFLFDASFKNVFVNRIDFTSHCAFIGGDFIGLEKDSISWDFHTFIDLNDISNKDKVLVNFNELTVSND